MHNFFTIERKRTLEKLDNKELYQLKSILEKIINKQKPVIPLRKSSLLPSIPKRSSSLNWKIKRVYTTEFIKNPR